MIIFETELIISFIQENSLCKTVLVLIEDNICLLFCHFEEVAFKQVCIDEDS